jgi:hypothetical protein
MTKQLLVTSILAVTGLLGSVVPSAHALSSQGINFSSVGNSRSGDFVLGYRFTVNGQNITVDRLGTFDDGQNGLLTSNTVGIFRESDQSLVVSATVPSGTTANLTGFFRYVPVASTILTANTTYRIGANFFFGLDPYSFNNAGFTVDPAITYNSAVEESGSTFAYPSQSFGNASNGFFGGNFTFTTPVPFEFSPALGLGVLGAAFVLKQKLKKK